MRKFGAIAWLISFSCAFWLVLDYAYTTYISPMGASPRIHSAVYSHGLTPKFEGDDRWGARRYRFVTNSLGFRDQSARDVPLKATMRRVLLIGDSFTEGTGVAFEESFAGLLYAAGQARADKVEILNAAVISYRPTIYYKKIKHWIDQGLTLDEVVVFSDISDVADEATANDCVDDQERLPQGCVPKRATPPGISHWNPRDHFNMSIRLFNLVRFWVQRLTGTTQQQVIDNNPRAIWTIVGARADGQYQPLGVEGGIGRSIAGMQALADLLRSRNIPLTIAVYPWPTQLARDDRNSRQSTIWRVFCRNNCKNFIDLFPAFFAFKDAHADWYSRLYIEGDVHLSAAGNTLVFQEVLPHIMSQR